MTGIYRPPSPFSASELQSLAHAGVLSWVLGDVYAEVSLPQGGT
ncbi:hypothetical protein [Nesterenkonia flava]